MATDRQTDRRTEWTRPSHKAALAVASGGLTISSVIDLHNTSATRELSVSLDGQRLRHEYHQTYLGVILDRTLSYREHLTKTADKL